MTYYSALLSQKQVSLPGEFLLMGECPQEKAPFVLHLFQGQSANISESCADSLNIFPADVSNNVLIAHVAGRIEASKSL